MALYNCSIIYFPLLLVSLIISYAAATVLLPRGVPLSRKIFYNPSQKFNCLDGSGLIPFYFINDDYCDCEDGSDEPGTSACSTGVFSCLNRGYDSKVLPSSMVNDGICDCCDASDEYNSTADCLDNCKELGYKAERYAKTAYIDFSKGKEIRDSYIEQGKQQKEEYKVQLKELQKQAREALRIKLQVQELKDKAEAVEKLYLAKEKVAKEAHRQRVAEEKELLSKQQKEEQKIAKKAFAELDLNKDNKLTVKEVQKFPRFDYDNDGKVSEKEAKFYMHKKDELSLSEFLSNGWKIMKPAFTMEQFAEDALTESSSTTSTSALKSNKKEKSVKSHTDAVPDMPDIDDKKRNKVFEDAAISRKKLAEANKKLEDIQAEVWNMKQKLEFDFGVDDEFLILENQCIEFSAKQYLYKLCLFERILQVFKASKEEVLIGLWDSWGPTENARYSSMKYSKGASCWNGPQRSAEVIVKCGIENKILSCTETSPCTYLFELTTPAACKDIPDSIEKYIKSDIAL